jgi:hypothetical protein
MFIHFRQAKEFIGYPRRAGEIARFTSMAPLEIVRRVIYISAIQRLDQARPNSPGRHYRSTFS